MTHLVDKDALSAKIKKRYDEYTSSILKHYDAYKEEKAQELGKILTIIDTLEVKEVPIWEKVSPDTGQTTLYKDGDKSYLERFGYRIDLKDLDKLPKNNSTHRTPADIEAAMQEVEDKSEAYTNAHRGERDDDVLSQMRGEPVSEDLDEAGKEWLRPQLDKSYANYGEDKMMELTHFDGYEMLEAIEFGAKWKEQQLMKNVVLETEVLRDSDGDGVDTPYESWLTLANTEISELPESLGLKDGDKVKIVIVKSE